MSKVEKLISEKTKANNDISKLTNFLKMSTSLQIRKEDPRYSSPNFLWLDDEDKEGLDNVINNYIEDLINKRKLNVRKIDSLLKKLEDYL